MSMITLGERVTTTPISLDLGLERAMSIEEWSDIGRRLGGIGNASLWWIGDWMLTGEIAYGSTYEEAEAITGFATQTLKNITHVCRKVLTSVREEKLSFNHHAAIAMLDVEAQERWLSKSLADGLSVMDLREQIRATKQIDSAPTTAAVVLRFQVDPDRETLWRQAADHAGYDLNEWVAQRLDESASKELDLVAA